VILDVRAALHFGHRHINPLLVCSRKLEVRAHSFDRG